MKKTLLATTQEQKTSFRAFFAVSVSKKVQRYIADITDSLRSHPTFQNIKWTQPENLHITLRFLGNISTDTSLQFIEQVSEALHNFSPFSIRFARLSAFPSTKAQKALILKPNPITSLASLAIIIDRIVTKLGISEERKPFQPHLTLGRISNKPYPDLKGIAISELSLKIDHIKLFRSNIKPEGSVYTPLATIPFHKEIT